MEERKSNGKGTRVEGKGEERRNERENENKREAKNSYPSETKIIARRDE
jgi:hypothetical protein